MKSFIVGVIALFILGCKSSVKESLPATNSGLDTTTIHGRYGIAQIDSTLYTDQDSVVIVPEQREADSLIFTKQEFNDIVTGYQELYAEWPDNPDITYSNRGSTKHIIDTAGGRRNISFEGEAGKDTYYILYAYFLQKKTGNKQLAGRRSKLIKVYTEINNLFGHIQYGGTYFGHQFYRIIGYAEYSIYSYSEGKEYFEKGYNIEKQKALYLASLRQLIEDEISIDQEQPTQQLKKERKQKLLKIVDTLQQLITDYFYLTCAQEFHYSHY